MIYFNKPVAFWFVILFFLLFLLGMFSLTFSPHTDLFFGLPDASGSLEEKQRAKGG